MSKNTCEICDTPCQDVFCDDCIQDMLTRDETLSGERAHYLPNDARAPHPGRTPAVPT